MQFSSVMRHLCLGVALCAPLALTACNDDEKQSATPVKPEASAIDTSRFTSMGEFSVLKKATYTEVRDGAGRVLALVPPGGKAPVGFSPTEIITVPAKRVIAYGAFEVGIMRALGVSDALVGVTNPKERWYVDDVREGFDSGRIQFVGSNNSLDFERIKTLHPDLILTWDPSIVPMMDSLGIPVVVTSTPIATCLNTKVRFVEFLAPFFGKEQEATAYYNKVKSALDDIHTRTKGYDEPKVMWGDIYEKRVLVEPGNAWVAQLVGLAQSDYKFEDVYGTSCVEISQERFLYSGEDADIYFTYRTPQRGATSKAALARTNPLIAGIRPLSPDGKTYAPLPHYSQSSDRLDDILTEISAILHPDLYPNHSLEFFRELPDVDPVSAEAK